MDEVFTADSLERSRSLFFYRYLFFHFADINECLEGGRPQCGQLCTNTLGSFQCSCLAGYTIETDRWSCFVQGEI